MNLRITLFIALTAGLASFTAPAVQAQNRPAPLASRGLQIAYSHTPQVQLPAHRTAVKTPNTATTSRNNATFMPAAVPVANRIALGAYVWQSGQCAPGDGGAVEAWRASVGRLPQVWLIYQGWTGWNQFPADQARRAQQLGSQLLVTWEPWNSSTSAGWSCSSIAAGKHDTYIRQYARAVRDSRVPVMIRLAHEMNGDWYPWGTAYKGPSQRHNGNTPAHYVAMWRHIVNIFRNEGATNARWVWSPNIHYLNRYNTLNGQNNDLAQLYPGDNYVDWLGLSVYNDGARRSWNSFTSLIDGAYAVVTRLSNKPLMIAEMGATESGAPSGTSKAAWIEQALTRDIPQRYPRVRLVNWFHRDKTSHGESNYRFDSSPASLRAFRYAANSPLYSGDLR